MYNDTEILLIIKLQWKDLHAGYHFNLKDEDKDQNHEDLNHYGRIHKPKSEERISNSNSLVPNLRNKNNQNTTILSLLVIKSNFLNEKHIDTY